uniref:Uncharacterized protein n=1 Tax=Anopheles christyi TaxID=43041 RepID=A0A182KHW1_9DIPT
MLRNARRSDDGIFQIWTSQRTVCGNDDVMLAAKLYQLALINARIAFDLIRYRFNFAVRQQTRQLLAVEIRHPDALHLTLLHQRFHRLPRVEIVDVGIDRFTVGIHRPVDKVQIDILQPEIVERFLARFRHMFRGVKSVPNLRDDEHIFPLDDAFRYFGPYRLP